jgi:hypothetical protein
LLVLFYDATDQRAGGLCGRRLGADGVAGEVVELLEGGVGACAEGLAGS